MRGSNTLPTLPSTSWKLYTEHISAGEQHGRDLVPERAVWDVRVTRMAMVLGSRQDESLLNVDQCGRNDVDVVHRRSGGGIVFLAPGEHVWLDVVVPRGDVLWSDDVARSLGVSDKEAAIAKQSNLIGSLAQLLAKANELSAAKAKREAKKTAKV